MNIQEKVKILFKTYDVQQEKNLHDMEDDLCGQIHYLTKRIILSEDSTEEQKKATP